uniref:Uncharacterized protein n=1 Tax=Acrobeloides nanus TaxID=290746 RepID=A0A914BYQ3_9BILA
MVSQEIQEILELLSRQKNLIEAGKEIFKNLDKEQLCEYSIDLILKLNELEKSTENVVNGIEFASAGISLRFVKSFILYASNTIVKKTTSKTSEKTIESSNDTRKELKISDEDIRKIWGILIRMDLPLASEKAQKIYETFMDRFTDETEQRKNLVQDLIQALIKGIENDEVSLGAWTFLVTDARMWDYVAQNIFIRMLMNEQIRKEHLRKYNTSDCDSIFCKKTNNLVDMVKEITEENFPIRNFTFDSFRQQLTDFIERLSPEDSSDERINEDYAKFLFHKYLKEHNPFPKIPSLGMEEIEGVDWNKPGFLQLPKNVQLQ